VRTAFDKRIDDEALPLLSKNVVRRPSEDAIEQKICRLWIVEHLRADWLVATMSAAEFAHAHEHWRVALIA
jgi:hypothetical protein